MSVWFLVRATKKHKSGKGRKSNAIIATVLIL